MDVLTKILLATFSTGFFGNLILYWFKRRDAINDRDKDLLEPIINEVCNVCGTADIINDNINRISKRLDELHKKQLKLFKDADDIMRNYNTLQDELMSVYAKDEISASDRINMEIIRKQIDDSILKRCAIMDEALSIPKEEQKIISEFNIYIQNEISRYKGLTHRLTNTYKLSNKKTLKIVCQQLTRIDNANKKIINTCESYPTILLSPPHLFNLYKIATDSRLKLTLLI